MKIVNVKKVGTKHEMDDFVKFTGWLYTGCQYYVPDLDMDIREAFDPRKNAGLEFPIYSLSLHTMKTGNL